MRELTLEELELISGGTNTDVDGGDIVVVGDGGDDWGDWGDWGDYGDDYGDYGDGGGGDGGGDGGGGGPDAVPLTGDDCPVAQAGAQDALRTLYASSPTAAALIDAMVANGTSLNLIVASLSGFGAQARFDAANNQVLWDPFLVVQGTNADGSTYTLSPIEVLAHELVHAGHPNDPAYQGHDSEALVMQIANQIGAELNNAIGANNYETNRTSHTRDSLYNSNSVISDDYSISRPGCN